MWPSSTGSSGLVFITTAMYVYVYLRSDTASTERWQLADCGLRHQTRILSIRGPGSLSSLRLHVTTMIELQNASLRWQKHSRQAEVYRAGRGSFGGVTRTQPDRCAFTVTQPERPEPAHFWHIIIGVCSNLAMVLECCRGSNIFCFCNMSWL